MSDDIVKRLHRQVEEQLWYEGGYRHMTLANPDGPEAAAEISSLRTRLAEVLQKVRRYDEALNTKELAPNGDDYSSLVAMILGGYEYQPPKMGGR